MQLKINKKIWLDIVITSLFFFAYELIFKVIVGYDIIAWSTIRILLSTIIIVFLWNFIFLFFSKRKHRLWANAFLLLIVTAYGFAQIGFLNFIGLYMSLGTSSQLGAVTNYLKEYFNSFYFSYYLVWLPFIIYLVYILAPKKEIIKDKTTIKNNITRFQLITTSTIFLCLYYLTLIIPFMQNDLQLISNIDLIANTANSGIAVNQFGPTVFGLLDIKGVVFPYKDDGEIAENIIELYEEPTGKVTPRIIDDTVWEELISHTYDRTYNNLNYYFLNRKITNKNEYTGYFKDKNVIILMLESINTIIEHEEYFPNFAKMLEHGWYWENNYSPRNSCATMNNEMSGLTSLFTINNVCTANEYRENKYFTSLFNQFQKNGYYTSSYHDYNQQYYFRRIIHANMGSMDYYDVDNLEMPYDAENYAEWPNDADFVHLIADKFMNEDKFFAWFTTVSAHQPYATESTLGSLYYDLFNDTNYNDTQKRLLSKMKVTDDCLGALISELKSHGKLNDTVIVLYGDHYPYAMSDSDLQDLVSHDMKEGYNRERTPFLIYNPKLKAKTFTENTSYMNVAPTILNLFDIEYDPRLYLGEDLFDEDYSGRLVLTDGSWEDKIARYNAGTSNITYFSEQRYTSQELRTINNNINNKIRMSSLAITSNYFEYLEEGLKIIKEGEKEE